MRAHLSQFKLVTLCMSLLTLLAPALVGCGQYVCNVAYAAPARAVLTVDNGVVYGLGDKLSAMRSSDGKVLWQNGENPYVGVTTGLYYTGAPVAPLVVEGGRVYVASLAAGLYVLDAMTGRVIWRATLDPSIFNSIGTMPAISAPAVDQGTAVMVAANGVGAWSVSDGQPLWLTHFPGGEDSALADSAALAAGMVFVAQGGTQTTCGHPGKPPRVLALRNSDGKQLWQDSI